MKPGMFEKELSGYSTHLAAKGKAQATIRWRKSPLGVFFVYLRRRKISDLKEVTRTHIDDYSLYLKEGYRTQQGKAISEGTYRQHIIVLKDFFLFSTGLL